MKLSSRLYVGNIGMHTPLMHDGVCDVMYNCCNHPSHQNHQTTIHCYEKPSTYFCICRIHHSVTVTHNLTHVLSHVSHIKLMLFMALCVFMTVLSGLRVNYPQKCQIYKSFNLTGSDRIDPSEPESVMSAVKHVGFWVIFLKKYINACIFVTFFCYISFFLFNFLFLSIFKHL